MNGPISAASRPAEIAIVMAVLNRATVVQRAIDSVCSQTVPVELVVVDGGSTDGTVDILQRNGFAIAAWISEPDKGIYDAWNKGVERSKAPWLIFLGSDDELAGVDALEKLLPMLARLDDKTPLAYGRTIYVDGDGNPVREAGTSWKRLEPLYRAGVATLPPAVVYRRSAFDRAGAFDQGFRITGDYEWSLRATKTAPPAFLDLVVIRAGAGGISWGPRQQYKILFETRRGLKKNGSWRPNWRWYKGVARNWAYAHLDRFRGRRP